MLKIKLLLHRLFGWNYLYIEWGYDNSSAVRVRTLPNGDRFCVLNGKLLLLDPQKPGSFENSSRKYTPLTWKG